MTKIFLKGFLLFISLSTISIAKSQSSDSTVTIIFAGDRSKAKAKKKKDSEQKNIIKVSPTGIFVGQIPIIYERKIADNVSIQASFGVTNQNYIRSAFIKAQDNEIAMTYPWDNSAWSHYDEAEGLYSFTTRKVELGTMFSIQPKFYIEDDALDGGFVGFSYNMYKYKFSTPAAVYNASSGLKFTGASQSESESITDFMLHYGKQTISGHFSLEYSSAIGLRKVEGTKYVAASDASTAKKFIDGFGTYKQTLFNYELAIRVGYVF
jgi:hypothetical protein